MESQMIQILAARIQLAKMRAEEGQALVEYALIISLIAVVAIGTLTITGVNVNKILTSISDAL
jgi:Flp pilus assembly pilin Flp